MDTMKICPGCQKPLAPNAPDGLCPECLAKAGLPTGMDLGPDSQAESGRTAFAAPSVEEVARLFPQLEILGFIGQGGMGAVYRARQKELDRVVALKILPPDIGRDPAFAERFTREARALAKLNHPGVVTLYEFGRADGLFFFLMEFVDGVNLRQLFEAGRLSPREALAIVPQICDALQYAHDQGIVHRDIKPENILLDRQGRVKVADFGLAKLVARDEKAGTGAQASAASTSAVTEAGKVMGTPQYMAPEQREHPQEVDHRADIYSLGVVFYQMLTGELPGKRIELPSRKVQIDVRLDEVVLRALEKDPELRYQTASEVKTDVEMIVSTPGSRAGQPKESSAAPDAVWFSTSVLPELLPGERIVQSKKRLWALWCKSRPTCRFFFSLPPLWGAGLYLTDRRILLVAHFFGLGQSFSIWFCRKAPDAQCELLKEVSIGQSRLLGPFLQLRSEDFKKRWFRSLELRLRLYVRQPEWLRDKVLEAQSNPTASEVKTDVETNTPEHRVGEAGISAAAEAPTAAPGQLPPATDLGSSTPRILRQPVRALGTFGTGAFFLLLVALAWFYLPGLRPGRVPSVATAKPVTTTDAPSHAGPPAVGSGADPYPMHTAARQGAQQAVTTYLDMGSPVDSRNAEGQTLLHLAAAHGHQALAGFLLTKGAEINATDKNGRTPLSFALANGHSDMAAFLAEKGADKALATRVPATSNSAATDPHPLHTATCKGEKAALARLIESGSPVDARNDEGQTPLHLAAAYGHRDLAAFLLEKGAALDASDKHGRTPLAEAMANCLDGMTTWLASQGANPALAGRALCADDLASPALALSLKIQTLPAFEKESHEPGVLLDSPRVCFFAPKRKETEARVVFPYLVKAYDELHRITGVHTYNKLVVYAFPAGNTNITGGTSGPDSIEYDESNLDLASQEEWTQYRVPHVSGIVEEMAHCFVTATRAKFGWEMLGWSLGVEACAKVANNPKFARNVALTRQEQEKTFQCYLAAGCRFPDDLPGNLCDRIHAWILYDCSRPYGPSFWSDFYSQVRRQRDALFGTVRQADSDSARNARCRITIGCFDQLAGLQFSERLKKASISVTTDVKSLKPEAPGWNRRLGP